MDRKEFVSLKAKIQSFFDSAREYQQCQNDLKLTKPENFSFKTEERNELKALDIRLTTEEKEIREIENHKHFKAKTVDPRILYGVQPLGLPKF